MGIVNFRVIMLLVIVVALLASCVPSVSQPKTPDTKSILPGESTPSSPAPKEETQKPLAASHPVPTEYEQLYISLSQKLDGFDKTLDARCKGGKKNIVFAAELLSANCHMGEKLLTEDNYRGILIYLDRLQSMGVNGVKIAIDYPFFMPEFPNYEGYLKFYKQLMQECKARKLTVFIANGNLFVNTPFTDLKYSTPGLTLTKYRQGKRQTVEAIIRELHPDYLSIANEPTTEYMTVGIKQTPYEFAETARFVLSSLDHVGTLMGAGTGTWNDMSYIKELVKIPELEYIYETT